jgi:uncharacterized protein YbaR (Trm112 family)
LFHRTKRTTSEAPCARRQAPSAKALLVTFGSIASGGYSLGIDPELLEILACPNCKTPVVLVHDETALKCKQCHRVYPIREDIPVMLVDEATIEP